MAKPLVGDAFQEMVESLPPNHERRFRYPGRLPVSNRQALTGILFMLKSGVLWEMPPRRWAAAPA